MRKTSLILGLVLGFVLSWNAFCAAEGVVVIPLCDEPVTQTLSDDTTTVKAGYYEATTLEAVDGDLASANIKNGVDIFGVTGRLVDGSNATRVPKTGQTDCWDEGGNSIACTGTGQDGEYQLGVLPEVTPSSGVYGSYTVYGWGGVRFTDNLDGTVTDNLTGLIWLKDASCSDLAGTDSEGSGNWTTALSASNTLADGTCGLSDGSYAGDWRLPNINELHSLVDPTQGYPALPDVHPFTGVKVRNPYGRYWSSTTYGVLHSAWLVDLASGYVNFDPKTSAYAHYVWPVRGGQ